MEILVNGSTYEVAGEPDRPLLWVLRDELGLTGTKEGCDEGDCGACTVWVNGRPTLACITLARAVEGAEVTTIESLSQGDTDHPLVESFASCDALQCGFCTPGMVMTSLACINKRGKPTREQMVHDLSGNLCRCGTYGRVMEAIERTTGGK